MDVARPSLVARALKHDVGQPHATRGLKLCYYDAHSKLKFNVDRDEKGIKTGRAVTHAPARISHITEGVTSGA